MKTSQVIKTNVLAILRENNKWMTANELVECGDREHLQYMTKRNSFMTKTSTKYDGHSHPVFRVLTGMINKGDCHNVYSPEIIRRIRKTGPETGSYEYAIGGAMAYLLRCKTAIKNS